MVVVVVVVGVVGGEGKRSGVQKETTRVHSVLKDGEMKLRVG